MFNSEDVVERIVIVPKHGGNSCKLSSMVQNEDGTIDLNFVELGTNAQFRHRYFDFKQDDQTEEQYQKAGMNFIGHLKHLIGCFYSEADRAKIKVSGSNFNELGTAFMKYAPKSSNVTVKLKLVYNNKGYATLPKFPSFASSDLKPADFKYTDYDKMTPPSAAPDKETVLDTEEPRF